MNPDSPTPIILRQTGSESLALVADPDGFQDQIFGAHLVPTRQEVELFNKRLALWQNSGESSLIQINHLNVSEKGDSILIEWDALLPPQSLCLGNLWSNQELSSRHVKRLAYEATRSAAQLSAMFGQDDYWVQLHPDTIFRCPDGSFLFCPSPRMTHDRPSAYGEMDGICHLVETLMDWTGKAVTPESGKGLGRWLLDFRHRDAQETPWAERLQSLENLLPPELILSTQTPIIPVEMPITTCLPEPVPSAVQAEIDYTSPVIALPKFTQSTVLSARLGRTIPRRYWAALAALACFTLGIFSYSYWNRAHSRPTPDFSSPSAVLIPRKQADLEAQLGKNLRIYFTLDQCSRSKSGKTLYFTGEALADGTIIRASLRQSRSSLSDSDMKRALGKKITCQGRVTRRAIPQPAYDLQLVTDPQLSPK